MTEYQWTIRYVLKSGIEETAVYIGHEDRSIDVAKRIARMGPDGFILLSGRTGSLFVHIGEIAVFEVSAVSC